MYSRNVWFSLPSRFSDNFLSSTVPIELAAVGSYCVISLTKSLLINCLHVGQLSSFSSSSMENIPKTVLRISWTSFGGSL